MKIKKFFIAFLVMFTAFVLVGCAEFSQEDYDKALADLAAVEASLATAQADLATVNAAKTALETQLATSNTAKETAETALAAANTAKTALEAQVAAKTAEIAGLEDDVDAEEALKVAALAALAALQLDLEGVEDELEAAETDLATAQASILALNAAYAQLQGLAFIAPTSIEVFGDELVYVGDTSLAIEEADLEFEPANAFLGFLWTSSDPTIATVNQLGQVTGLRGGEVMICATSLLDPEVFYEAEWLVLERGEALDIATRAVNEIEAQLPKFVGANLVLPMPSNESVQVTFYLTQGDAEIVDGIFLYSAPAIDAVVQIYAEVVYGTATVKKTMNLQVVKDLADNDFLKMEMAQMYVSLALADALAGVKIAANQFLPTGIRGVAITWSTNQRFAITLAGEYTRLNDDIPVRLSANFMINSLAAPRFYDVIAKGYSPAEKIAYIMEQGDLKGLLTGAFNTNINLPVKDSKFGVLMTWESLSPTLFDDDGVFLSKELAADTTAKFNVTFEYTSFAPVAAGVQSFKGETAIEMEVEVDVLKATATSMAAFDFLAAQEVVPTWFPYGLSDRVGGNALPDLPTTCVGHPDVTITWTANQEHFDGLTLKVQYLRYQETVLKATFSKADTPNAVAEFVVNIGISQDPGAYHMGGRFLDSQLSTDPFIVWDKLNTLSYWDKYVGFPLFTTQQTASAFPDFSTFSGFTLGINGHYLPDKAQREVNGELIFEMINVPIQKLDDDGDPIPVLDAEGDPVLDAEGNPVYVMVDNWVQKLNADGDPIPVMKDVFVQNEDSQRYQYYIMEFTTAYVVDVKDDGTPILATGNLHGLVAPATPAGTGHNHGLFYVNLTDKPIKVPIGTHAAGPDLLGRPQYANGLPRDMSLSMDGFRVGFVADKDGNVILGNGNAVLQAAVERGTMSIEIPAHGYAMTFKTQFNVPAAVGVFAHVGTQIEIQRFDLASKNDIRFIKFERALDAAEAGLDLIEDGETTTINVAEQLKTAKYFGTHPIVTPAELANFDFDRWDDLVDRIALVYDAEIAAIKAAGRESEDYAIILLALYNKYLAFVPEIQVALADEAWLVAEGEFYSEEFEITLSLNGGELWVSSRQEIVDMFYVDLYAHLTAKSYPGLPATLEGFLETTFLDTFFTDPNMRMYMYEYYKDNADADPKPDYLTVDPTGNATQFFRQAAYNEKWLPLLQVINEWTMIGHAGGRDILGRFGLMADYQYGYENPASPWYFAGPITATAGATARFKEYLYGSFAYGGFREQFLPNTWTLSATNSQAKVDAMDLIYTAGDAVISLPVVISTDRNYVAEWYTDAALTQKAVLSAVGLGYQDVALYAKFIPAETFTYSLELNDGDLFIQDKVTMGEAFLKDFYTYLSTTTIAPTEDLMTFMHGVGKTSGFEGTWHNLTAGSYMSKLYAANSKNVDATQPFFINQPEYNARWMPLFDFMHWMMIDRGDSSGWWVSPFTGQRRINLYLQEKTSLLAQHRVFNFDIDADLEYEFDVDSDIQLPIPVKTGFVFGGWFDNAALTGTAKTHIVPGITGDLTLYAKWTPAA